MRKVNKIFENEVMKFLSSKKMKFIILFIVGMTILAAYAYNDMANAVAAGLEKTINYPDDLKTFLANISGTNFMLAFLSDVIYRSELPFYLIFIVIIAVEVFSEDYQRGTLKFTLLTGVECKDVLLGKFLFMAYISLAIALINFVFSFIVGQIVFGGNVFNDVLLEVLILTVLVVAPAMALSSIIFLLSQTNLSSKIIMIFGILFTIFIGILDAFTGSKRFSPVGAIGMFNNEIPSTSAEYYAAIGVSIIYVIVLTSIGYKIAKIKDLYK